MDISLFISRFLYRNRYLFLIGSSIVTLLVAYFTQFLPKTYTVETSIYTGIVSSTTIRTDDAAITTNVSTTFDNLVNLVKSKNTMEDVGLKLFAMNMIYGDPKRDNQYITAQHYNELQEIVPNEVKKMIDKSSVEKTANNLRKMGRNSGNNFIYKLLSGDHPHYSFEALSKVQASRVQNSDIIEISYTNNDPGITTNTVKLFSSELLDRYNDLRYSSTNDVIAYFQREVAKLKAILNGKEDEMTNYSVANRVINFPKQTEFLASSYEDYENRYEEAMQRFNSASDLLRSLEKQMDSRQKAYLTNKKFLQLLDNITDYNSKITEMEMFSSDNAKNKDTKLNEYKDKLRKTESEVAKVSKDIDLLKYTKEGLSLSEFAQEWVQAYINYTKSMAELAVLDKRRMYFDDKYRKFSPVGTELKRRERDITVTEESYLTMLHALNEAILRKKNIQLSTANLDTVSDPIFPLAPNKNKRWLYIIAAFFGSLAFLILYKLMIELLDRTLRDGERTKRLTGEPAIGALVGKGELRYRGYSKTWNRQSMANIASKIMKYIDPDKPNYINILSIEKGEGKSYVMQYLHDELERQGLSVKSVVIDDDITSTPGFMISKDFSKIVSAEEANNYHVILIEYPYIIKNSTPQTLLKEASFNILVANARRVWRISDTNTLNNFKEEVGTTPFKLLLNNASRFDVEDFTGDLPPEKARRSFSNKFMHIGLTSKDIPVEK